jgi:hypothetical protein
MAIRPEVMPTSLPPKHKAAIGDEFAKYGMN